MAFVHPPRASLPSRSSFALPLPEVDRRAVFASPPDGATTRSVARVSWLTGVATAFLLATSGSYAQGSAAAHQHAHVHGVAKLGVAVQDKAVTITLESPLDSVIGFEHRPTTAPQRASVEALQTRLKTPQELFRFDGQAACTFRRGKAESAIFQPPAPGGVADEHADLDAEFEFTCAHPDRLTTLEVGLFQAYPKLQRLEVDVATGKGQFKRDLRSPQRTISLVR
jgi:hypothetical protein